MSLTDFVIMPGADYKAICDSVRAKTGETKDLISGEISPLIDGITGGGSGESSDLVKYVTFMSEDGKTELFKMPVLNGDDCKDPVSHGDIAKPTKASTNTQNFSYSGWASTSCEGASSSALAKVTEDRIVFAAFDASVRYYTVRFFDGNSLLNTMEVTYGGTAEYVAEKEGYGFDGWIPSNENITSNTDCYAQWTKSITFANASWEDIRELSESGEIANVFKVGDEKSIVINGENVTLRIAGFNHDDLADGSGKAGVTIIAKTVPKNIVGKSPYIMYIDTDRLLVENLYISHLPTELQSSLKTVSKECEASSNKGTDTTIRSCKIFALSYHEAGCITTLAENYYNKLGSTYELFNDSANKINIKYPDGTNVNSVWLRGYQRSGGSYGLVMQSTHKMTTSTLTTNLPYLFGFCI